MKLLCNRVIMECWVVMKENINVIIYIVEVCSNVYTAQPSQNAGQIVYRIVFVEPSLHRMLGEYVGERCNCFMIMMMMMGRKYVVIQFNSYSLVLIHMGPAFIECLVSGLLVQIYIAICGVVHRYDCVQPQQFMRKFPALRHWLGISWWSERLDHPQYI